MVIKKEICLDDSSRVGELLKKLRRDRNITQEELASFASLSRTGVVKMEGSKSDIKLSTLIKVTNLLGLDLVLKERSRK